MLSVRPILIALIVTLVTLIMQRYCDKYLQKWGFTVYRDIDGLEELPNFFDTFKFADANELLIEEHEMNDTYGIQN